MQIRANIVDVHAGRVFFGICEFNQGRISEISELGDEDSIAPYLMPGFIDAHVHIESSMLVPTEFARIAVRHGTVATVSDPHEIANVLGAEGVLYLLDNAKHTPLKIFFGVPSCVPATAFETAGDVIDSDTVRKLLSRNDLHYLAEMMNYPGVLHQDPEVMAKLQIAQELGKPVDGHAPGLTGEDAVRYINAGISTDHECVTYAEAVHKLKHGMHIIIREGSAAKNFEALHPLISEHPDRVMFCSDDKHPDDLLIGHLNQLAARAVVKGHGWQDVLRVACVNPVLHYGLNVGLLRKGDPADMVLVQDLGSFNVLRTFIGGREVYAENSVFMPQVPIEVRNAFRSSKISQSALRLRGSDQQEMRVIRAIDGSLLTEELHAKLPAQNGLLQPDLSQDILKIAVVNRYADVAPAVAFIHGFGLHAGAIASSVAHDSHNIVAVGTSDDDLVRAINLVVDAQGGVAAVGGGVSHILPLPVGGIMSDRPGEEVARMYTQIDRYAKEVLGSRLHAPFMTLSFMALLVIPQLKLSDRGLFDGSTFSFVDMVVS